MVVATRPMTVNEQRGEQLAGLGGLVRAGQARLP